ncbi:AI-2E family transporter [uncultured Thermanaerothrix sp.]|uniref:AI-2E family transporter n=1 Tax=uncultured Thermanaerothrix sp. TaxID=1195149 RepID=UPI0026198C84|nr:AI-2E family transporter [uncultured Thermanaerothrix sp.]
MLSPSSSPRWSSTTKLVVALTLVATLAGLLMRFRQVIGPLLMAFLIAYLLYPVVRFLNQRLHMPWRLASTLLFVLILVLLLGLLTLGGLAIVDQVQSLINFLQVQVRALPQTLESLTERPFEIGPFNFDLSTMAVGDFANQVLGIIQPVLTRLGNLVGALAAGAATAIGWTFFALLVAYFILADAEQARQHLINLEIPGYAEDLRRLNTELGRIWNAFLRGQLVIFTLTVVVYVLILGLLGLKFYFGLALLAGLARFIPYVGPAVAWVTYGLVAFLQGSTLFGLLPVSYALLVVGVAWVTDVIMDNLVVPRLMGEALRVHPAAVMVAAIISANLFGIIGVVLAAPVLASLKLLLTYALRKLFDLDPWEGLEVLPPPRRQPLSFLSRIRESLQQMWKRLIQRLQRT